MASGTLRFRYVVTFWVERLRDTLNHFKTSKRIAETAFDVISRCRVTSVSSKVGGTEGTCSGAANYINLANVGEIFWIRTCNNWGEHSGSRRLRYLRILACGDCRQQEF